MCLGFLTSSVYAGITKMYNKYNFFINLFKIKHCRKAVQQRLCLCFSLEVFSGHKSEVDFKISQIIG